MRTLSRLAQKACAVFAIAAIAAACGPPAGQVAAHKSAGDATSSGESTTTMPTPTQIAGPTTPTTPMLEVPAPKFARFSDMLEPIKQLVVSFHTKAYVFDPSPLDPDFVYYFKGANGTEVVGKDLRITQTAGGWSDEVAQYNYNGIIANGTATKQTAALVNSSMGLCLYTTDSSVIGLRCGLHGTMLFITRPSSTPASAATDMGKIADQLFSARMLIGNPTDPYPFGAP